MTKAQVIDLATVGRTILSVLAFDDGQDCPSYAAIMEQKQSLALVHWGLERWPFRTVPEADQFYPTAGHTEALARMEYLVDGRRRMGLLLGELGVGKSLVLQAAARQLARQGRAVVLVDATGLSSREFTWQIACGLGAAPRDDSDVARLWRQIADRVVENRLQQTGTVLFVDEAGQAGPDALMQLVRLGRLDPSPAARWTIVLAAEASQAARWNESLRNLVDLRIDLVPWSSDDTIGYVQTALVDAGRIEPLFDDGALSAIYELTGGVARQVARLADFALLAGAAARLSTIDAATVEAAHDEIAWPTAAAY
jgi:type II secretory pathway predicted ATPase ExeA